MPPHPEVPAALRRLRDHGFRLFTPTDNTLAISGRQLEHAGVVDVFERRFSAEHGYGPSRSYELIWNKRHVGDRGWHRQIS
jgi:hypothetical protein